MRRCESHSIIAFGREEGEQVKVSDRGRVANQPFLQGSAVVWQVTDVDLPFAEIELKRRKLRVLKSGGT